MPASTAAFLMKCLCSSLHSAGTVSTQRILVLTTEPTYSLSLVSALSEMKRSDSDMTVISGISRPSTLLAFWCMWSRCILY